jgi:hypothetical protein
MARDPAKKGLEVEHGSGLAGDPIAPSLAKLEGTNCRGSLPPAINFYRLRVGLGWLAQETTGFILVRASVE